MPVNSVTAFDRIVDKLKSNGRKVRTRATVGHRLSAPVMKTKCHPYL
jgi:hypothetical protein